LAAWRALWHCTPACKRQIEVAPNFVQELCILLPTVAVAARHCARLDQRYFVGRVFVTMEDGLKGLLEKAIGRSTGDDKVSPAVRRGRCEGAPQRRSAAPGGPYME
jgi:hypothetical protein